MITPINEITLMPPIDIGFYDNSHGQGGTVRYLQELIGSLDTSLFHPVFFAERAHEWHKDLADRGVEIVLLENAEKEPIRRGAQPFVPSFDERTVNQRTAKRSRFPEGLFWFLGLIKEIRQLRSLFRQRRVQILHTNNTGAEPCPIAARLAGVPCVIGTWHVDSTYDLSGKRSGLRYRFLEGVSMRALHHVIAVSEATKKDWIRRCGLGEKYQRRIDVIYNGIDPRRAERKVTKEQAKERLGFRSDTILVGSLGRLAPEKGYEYLIQAVAEMRKLEPKLQFVIGGAGPLEADLRQLTTKLGVASHVHFQGYVSEVGSFLEALDIYVQPSLCEALPFAVIEASCFGLPVVVSDVGGASEAVLNNATGLVVAAKNPTALAGAIVSLAQNPALCEAMGQCGRERALSLFDRKNMARDTMRVYKRLAHLTKEVADETMRTILVTEEGQVSAASIGRSPK